MWSFFPTERISFSKTIDASPEAVIAVLHDLDVFLRLHPFIVAVTPHPSNPSQLTITEALPILGCFKVKTTFQTTVDIQADGFTSNVVASAKTKQTTHYSARERHDNRTEVIEHATATVSNCTTCVYLSPEHRSKLKSYLGLFSPDAFYHERDEDRSSHNLGQSSSQV
jgi:hypothetical protein